MDFFFWVGGHVKFSLRELVMFLFIGNIKFDDSFHSKKYLYIIYYNYLPY